MPTSSLMSYLRHPARGTPYWLAQLLCNRSWHLPGNPKQVWHPARLIKEEGCVYLSVDTMHLKDPLALFGSEGSALTLPLFLLLPRKITLCRCSSTVTKDHLLVTCYGTKRPLALCADVPLNHHSFIHLTFGQASSSSLS